MGCHWVAVFTQLTDKTGAKIALSAVESALRENAALMGAVRTTDEWTINCSLMVVKRTQSTSEERGQSSQQRTIKEEKKENTPTLKSCYVLRLADDKTYLCEPSGKSMATTPDILETLLHFTEKNMQLYTERLRITIKGVVLRIPGGFIRIGLVDLSGTVKGVMLEYEASLCEVCELTRPTAHELLDRLMRDRVRDYGYTRSGVLLDSDQGGHSTQTLADVASIYVSAIARVQSAA